MADFLNFPSHDELDDLVAGEHVPPGSSSKIYLFFLNSVSNQNEKNLRYAFDSDLALSEKFCYLMEIVVEQLKKSWGGHTKDQLTEKMFKMAERLSGGIELA